MYGFHVIRPSRCLAFNGVGLFKIPGQVAALRPAVIAGTRKASTSSGLWLPHLTGVSCIDLVNFPLFFQFFFFEEVTLANKINFKFDIKRKVYTLNFSYQGNVVGMSNKFCH